MRYFVLSKGQMTYYEDEASQKLLGGFTVQNAKVNIESAKNIEGKNFGFSVKPGDGKMKPSVDTGKARQNDRVYTMVASSEVEKREWIWALKAHGAYMQLSRNCLGEDKDSCAFQLAAD